MFEMKLSALRLIVPIFIAELSEAASQLTYTQKNCIRLATRSRLNFTHDGQLVCMNDGGALNLSVLAALPRKYFGGTDDGRTADGSGAVRMTEAA